MGAKRYNDMGKILPDWGAGSRMRREGGIHPLKKGDVSQTSAIESAKRDR